MNVVLKNSGTYTYADYVKWDTDGKYEILDGVPYMLAAPSERHQDILLFMAVQLKAFLEGKPCKVIISPFDVCLNADGDNDRTVVQPDILVVCDRDKLDGKRCNGAPDFIIEILSPSNERHDFIRKFLQYQKAGVREYWVVDPGDCQTDVCVLEDGVYKFEEFKFDADVPVGILEGCALNLRDFKTNDETV